MKINLLVRNAINELKTIYIFNVGAGLRIENYCTSIFAVYSFELIVVLTIYIPFLQCEAFKFVHSIFFKNIFL